MLSKAILENAKMTEKKFRIKIVTRDRILTVQDENKVEKPVFYEKIVYRASLEKALKWAKNYVDELKKLKTVYYERTEIEEYQFVQSIPVDF